MNSCESDNKCCGRNCWAVAAAIVACLVFAALVWKTRQYTTPAPLGAARVEERAKAFREMRAAEIEALHSVGWVDQAKGIVRLPIDEALKLAEREWQDPAQARAKLLARVEKANAKPPEKPSQFE